jgi:hypothetical protein
MNNIENVLIVPNQIVEDATILSGIVEINRSVKIHLNNERCMFKIKMKC